METTGIRPLHIAAGVAVSAALAAAMSCAVAAPAHAAAKGTVKSVAVKNIQGKKATLFKGCYGELYLKMKVSGIKKSKVKVTYKSSDPTVVSVSKAGVLRGKKKGTATITVRAKAGNVVKTRIKVTVVKPQQAADDGVAGEDLGNLSAYTKKFATTSTSKVLSQQTTNSCYSPLSAYMALGMTGVGTNDGANGKTQTQILEALDVADADTLATRCNELMRSLTMSPSSQQAEVTDSFGNGLAYVYGFSEPDSQSTLRIANSVWCKKGYYKFDETFESTVKSKFDGESQAIDFVTEGNQITDWISNKTNGLLKPTFKFDDSVVAALVNTVYLKDGWQDKFNADATKTGTFYKADGTTSKADFMTQTIRQGFLETDTYTSASLGLGSHGTMNFYLPKEGVTPQDLVATSEDVEGLLAAEPQGRYDVTWKLPKFDYECSYSLNSYLQAMGITDMFSQTVDGDFGSMLIPANMIGNDSDPYIGAVQQGTKIAIDEDGVEAAAYTAAIACGTSFEQPEKKNFTLDRPFAYTIVAKDGTLLFAGTVQDPAATK